MGINIVGGGIAGFSCALHLLNLGHEVTLYEREKGIIDRVCGEGILPFGVEILRDLGIESEVRQAGRAFPGIAYHFLRSHCEASFPHGSYGIGIERGKLDQIFREACSNNKNFQLKTGQSIKPKDIDGKVLVADGIQSPWARSLGYEKKFTSRFGLRLRVQIDDPKLMPDRVTVHFCKHFEMYMTPTSEQVLGIAFLVNKDKLGIAGRDFKQWSQNSFRSYFPEFANCPIMDIATRAPVAGKLSGPPKEVHLLGDAYRAFDPISGAGMSFAMACGRQAAFHLHDVEGYYKSLAPIMASVNDFTAAILFLKGGGLRTSLMMRQLKKAPDSFAKILACHDGEQRFWHLGLGPLLGFLRL